MLEGLDHRHVGAQDRQKELDTVLAPRFATLQRDVEKLNANLPRFAAVKSTAMRAPAFNSTVEPSGSTSRAGLAQLRRVTCT